MIDKEQFTEKMQAMLDALTSEAEKRDYSEAISDYKFFNVCVVKGNTFGMFSNKDCNSFEEQSAIVRSNKSHMLKTYRTDDIEWLQDGVAFSIETKEITAPDWFKFTVIDLLKINPIEKTSSIRHIIPDALSVDEYDIVDWGDYIANDIFELKTYAKSESTPNGKYERAVSLLMFLGDPAAIVIQSGKWSDEYYVKWLDTVGSETCLDAMRKMYLKTQEVEKLNTDCCYSGYFYDELAEKIKEVLV